MELLQIKILNTAIERRLNQEIACYGLTYTQATILGFLQDRAGAETTQQQIEDVMGLTHPTVCSILKRMEQGGLIRCRRAPQDRRLKLVEVTEESRELAGTVRARIGELNAGYFAGISPEEQALLESLIVRMTENVLAGAEHPPQKSQEESV